MLNFKKISFLTLAFALVFMFGINKTNASNGPDLGIIGVGVLDGRISDSGQNEIRVRIKNFGNEASETFTSVNLIYGTNFSEIENCQINNCFGVGNKYNASVYISFLGKQSLAPGEEYTIVFNRQNYLLDTILFDEGVEYLFKAIINTDNNFIDNNLSNNINSVKGTPTNFPQGQGVNISNIQTFNIKHDRASIKWNTNIPANSWVFYSESQNGPMKSHSLEAYTRDHLISINYLKPNTTYYFYVSSRAEGSSAVQSQTMSFKTASAETTLTLFRPDFGMPEGRVLRPGEENVELLLVGFKANGSSSVSLGALSFYANGDTTEFGRYFKNLRIYNNSNNLISRSVIFDRNAIDFDSVDLKIWANNTSYLKLVADVNNNIPSDLNNFQVRLTATNTGNVRAGAVDGGSISTISGSVISNNFSVRQNTQNIQPIVSPPVSSPISTTPPTSNQITNINQASQSLAQGNVNELLSQINQLRNQVREQETQIKYLQNLTTELSRISATMQTAVNTFITYGVDDNTKRLGEGERAAVINSYQSAYGKLPNSESELNDVIKIANGRWPAVTNTNAESRAKTEFKNIYKREANMNNANDNAAVTIMAYGLRQRAENRNLNSESAGLKIFRGIYGKIPQSTNDWNILQAITYSGATR